MVGAPPRFGFISSFSRFFLFFHEVTQGGSRQQGTIRESSEGSLDRLYSLLGFESPVSSSLFRPFFFSNPSVKYGALPPAPQSKFCNERGDFMIPPVALLPPLFNLHKLFSYSFLAFTNLSFLLGENLSPPPTRAFSSLAAHDPSVRSFPLFSLHGCFLMTQLFKLRAGTVGVQID